MTKQKSKQTTSITRRKVAQEAASLLYFGPEKEFRQAKLKAADNLGTHVLPSNLEVALELDKLAQETEGDTRTQRLIQMRTEALTVMKALKTFYPLLIGSVWRGTIRSGSDIDIEVYHHEPKEVASVLKNEGLKIQKIEQLNTTEHGKTGTSTHIYAYSTAKHSFEIVVRTLEEKGQERKCDTFGDLMTGLTTHDLEKLLKENPTQQFLPT